MNAAAVLMALFNGAWQGVLLCVCAYFALRAFRNLNAATRYAIWSALLLIALLLPFANYAFSVGPVTRVVKLQPAPAPVERASLVVARTQSAVSDPAPLKAALSSSSAMTPRAAALALPDLREAAVSRAAQLIGYARYAIVALLLVVFIRLVLLARELKKMLAARGNVRPIPAPFEMRDPVRRPYGFAVSDDFGTPCVLGFRPALIVLPESLFASASEKELLSVVLHEHEHVMRFDDVQNVLHRLAGAIAFFLPGVMIALRELATCREQICDDAAVAGIGNRYAYARTLSTMAGWIETGTVAAPCFIFKRKQLLQRIEVLLDAAVNHSLRLNSRLALTISATVALVAIIFLRFQVPVFAERILPAAPHKPSSAVLPRAVAVAKQVTLPAMVTPKIAKTKEPKKTPPAKPAKTLTIIKTTTSKNGMVTTTTIKTTDAAPRASSIWTFGETASTSEAPAAAAIGFSRSARALAKSAASLAPVAVMEAQDVTDASRIEARAITVSPKVKDRGDLLDALAAAGYTNLSVDQLIELRNHGVSNTLIAAATQYFGRISADDLVKLADHGMSGIYLGELRSSGVRVGVDDAIRLRDHGVSSFLLAAGNSYFGRLSSSDLTRLADSGVSGTYLAELRAAGITSFSAADVVRMRNSGVSSSLVATLRQLGYRPSADDLVRLASHGVSSDYITQIQRIRTGRPSIDDIIKLHDAGFNP